HGRATDHLVAALEQVAAVAIHGGRFPILGPRPGQQLPSHRFHRQRPRQVGDPTRPGTRRQHHGARLVVRGLTDDAGELAVVADQRGDLVSHDGGAQSLRIAQQGRDEVIGPEAAVLWGPEGTQARLQPGPTLGDDGRFQDVGRFSLLPLPSHRGLELLELRLATGDLEVTALGYPDVDAAALVQRLRLATVEGAPRHAEGEERIVGGGLDLGRQHSGGRAPGLARQRGRADQGDPCPEQAERPGYGGPGGTATDYQNVSCEWHTVRNETFRCPAAHTWVRSRVVRQP